MNGSVISGLRSMPPRNKLSPLRLLGRRRISFRAFIGWFSLLRVVMLVAALQLSGVSHPVMDAAFIVFEVEHEAEQCPPNRSCDDCPPGCPNCHCPNTLRSVVPGLGVEIADTAPRFHTGASTADGQTPPRPDLPSLYRPPRSHRPVV